MKGFLLTSIVAGLEEQFGEKLIDELEGSIAMPAARVYSSLGDYPDDSVALIIQQAAPLVNMSEAHLAKLVGIHIFSNLIAMNSLWIEQSKIFFELIKSKDTALNRLQESAFPGFIAPKFECLEINPDLLEVNYKSSFLPADVAEGLICAMFSHFQEHFSIQRISTEPAMGYNQQFILRRRADNYQTIDLSCSNNSTSQDNRFEDSSSLFRTK